MTIMRVQVRPTQQMHRTQMLGDTGQFDELSTIGYAIARSMSLFDEVRTRFESAAGCVETLDAAWTKSSFGTCSQQERAQLARCITRIFSRRLLLQSTSAPKEDRSQASFLTDSDELSEMWGMIFADDAWLKATTES